MTILSAGTPNPDSGPDFLDAVVRIGNVTFRGDVEFHTTIREWNQHAHNVDSRYNRVVLHVVFETQPADPPSLTVSKRPVPVVILAPYLAGPVQDLWYDMIMDERAERLARIKCFRRNHDIPADTIRSWLKRLAGERMELKIRRFEQRLRQLAEEEKLGVKEPATRYGVIPFGLSPEELPPPIKPISPTDLAPQKLWDQLIYEGFMEALGYSKNRVPFLRLSRNVPLEHLRAVLEQFPRDRWNIALEAHLFGAAGLLKADAKTDAETGRYVDELTSVWKLTKPWYQGEVLGEADWQFFRLRPENFPTIRIAGAARFIPRMLDKNFFKLIIQRIKEGGEATGPSTLTGLFTVPSEQYWANHYRFAVAAPTLKRLVGPQRARDIVLNVVLPISFLYARTFRDSDVRSGAVKLLEQFKPLGANSITRMIERQLVRGKFRLDSAILQQGAIQLYKYYCVQERCTECAVGTIVFRS